MSRLIVIDGDASSGIIAEFNTIEDWAPNFDGLMFVLPIGD